jgi:L-arabinose isomerase
VAVTNEHLSDSARIALAYDELITRHDISAFGFYWWGVKDTVTQLRAQASLAVSRLAAFGRPGVTEGDVKTAMAMKLLDLLGAGGMFVEFFSMDFDEDFILMGHDGPSNINVAQDRPRLTFLDVHHGKSGSGVGIDFHMKEGPVTLVNLTEVDAGESFKLITTVGKVVPGNILSIGNPNCRVKIERRINEFMDAWCQEGPSHHIALGVGDHSAEVEAFAEAIGFKFVRI